MFYAFFFSAIKMIFFRLIYQFLSPDSVEIQPKFVRGSKRYGRRSTPEFIQPVSDLSKVGGADLEDEDVQEQSYNSAVPRKREVKGLRRAPDGQTPSFHWRSALILSLSA